jgi:hypothetical protein
MATLKQIPRGKKPGISGGIRSRLAARRAEGPPEPGLDIFIDELDAVTIELGSHVTGKSAANAAREALESAVDAADAKVDTWLRHNENYVDVEARDRRSPHAASARALHDAAFPDGLGPIDDYVVDQNVYCRAALAALRAPEHQGTIAAIGLPAAWVDQFEAAVSASEAAMDQLIAVRGNKSAHVGLGRDAEVVWIDVMVRLRRYVASRAKRGDTAKQMENKQLLEPLLVALQKLDAEAAARATRKKEKQAAGTKPANDADGATKAEAPQVSASTPSANAPSANAPSEGASSEGAPSEGASPAKPPAVSTSTPPIKPPAASTSTPPTQPA